MKVLILHNRVAVATGGQPMDEALFERLLKSYGDCIRRVDVTNLEALQRTLREAQKSERLEIVVVDF